MYHYVTMGLKKIDKGVVKDGEYKKVVLKTTVSPIKYKEFCLAMDAVGVTSESQYLQMCIQLGAELNLVKINKKKDSV